MTSRSKRSAVTFVGYQLVACNSLTSNRCQPASQPATGSRWWSLTRQLGQCSGAAVTVINVRRRSGPCRHYSSGDGGANEPFYGGPLRPGAPGRVSKDKEKSDPNYFLPVARSSSLAPLSITKLRDFCVSTICRQIAKSWTPAHCNVSR